MSTRQRNWNQFEAVILLEGYVNSLGGSVSREDVIKRVSQDLRKMALNQGEKIDETFRNEAGILFQMQSMESAFCGHTVSKPATKLFSYIVEIYRKNNADYKSILETAKSMINGAEGLVEDKEISCKDEFKKYLCSLVPSEQLNEYFWCYEEIEKYCLEQEVLQKPLFQTMNLNRLKKVKETIEYNPSFCFAHSVTNTKIKIAFYYYYTFIKGKIDSNKRLSTLKSDNNDSIVRTEEDERLSEKYPVIFKRIYFALQESTLKGEGLTQNEICDKTQRIARIAEIEVVLDNASWASFKEGKYWYSESIVIHNAKETKTNIKMENLAEYEKVLKEKFRQGFRMNSPIEIRRFQKAYLDLYGKEVQKNEDEVLNLICQLCVVNNDRAYLPAEILSDDLKTKLFNYIDKSFSEGKSVIYYSALCNEFADDFLDYPLHENPELLKQYLNVVGNKKYYINRSFISKEPNISQNTLEEVRSCLLAFNRPVKYEELFKALPHLPKNKIKSLLASNAEFVFNGNEEYFHASIIRLTDEELENIAEIIDLVTEEKNFISGNELYNLVEERYPNILDNNLEISIFGFRDALSVKLGERYSVIGNIISSSDAPLSTADVFGCFAKSRESFTLTELKTFAEEIGTPIYFDSVYKNSLRISQDQFVSNDQAHFSISETDAVLDRVCTGDYISIQEVTNFGTFPDAGHPWNIFLLEEYVAEYSDKYRLLHVGYNQWECAGAIVKRSAGINNFDDFVVDFLANTDVQLKKEPVLELLVKNGFLARRRYSKTESVLIRAKAQKNCKEVE